MRPRFCIGIMFQNNERLLRRHLPVFDLPFVDGPVGLDGGSQDASAQVFREHGGQVYERPFDYDYGAQANALIAACEDAGYTHLLRLDTDEIMCPEHILRTRWAVESGDRIYSLRRVHYVGDFDHVMDTNWVDPQWRVFPLNRGVHYPDMKVHEVPEGLPRANLYHLTIYHYGYAGKPSTVRWKEAVYDALDTGCPLPAREQFTDDRPLDFAVKPFPDIYPQALEAARNHHAHLD